MSSALRADDINCIVAWSTPLYVELSEAVDRGARQSVTFTQPVSEDHRLRLELWSQPDADGGDQLNARLFWRTETGKRWHDDNWLAFGGLGDIEDILFVGDYADPHPGDESGEFVHYYAFELRTASGDRDLSVRVWRIADAGAEPGLEFLEAWLSPQSGLGGQLDHGLAA